MKLPADLTEQLREALGVLAARSPGSTAEVARLLSAIRQESPMLQRRFLSLVEHAMSDPGGYSPDEQRLIGSVIVALQEWADGKPGPKPRGNEHRLSVYFTAEEWERLLEYCERHRVNRAEAIRRGLALLG